MGSHNKVLVIRACAISILNTSNPSQCCSTKIHLSTPPTSAGGVAVRPVLLASRHTAAQLHRSAVPVAQSPRLRQARGASHPRVAPAGVRMGSDDGRGDRRGGHAGPPRHAGPPGGATRIVMLTWTFTPDPCVRLRRSQALLTPWSPVGTRIPSAWAPTPLARSAPRRPTSTISASHVAMAGSSSLEKWPQPWLLHPPSGNPHRNWEGHLCACVAVCPRGIHHRHRRCRSPPRAGEGL